MRNFTFTSWLVSILASLALLMATAIVSAQTPPPGGDEVILSGFLTCPIGNGHAEVCPFRLHYVNLTAGQTYAIRMESSEFHPSLMLEDLSGNLLAADTDYFDLLNRTIVFRPAVTGEYRLIATSTPPTSAGFYMISMRELPMVARMDAALTPVDPVQNGFFHRTTEVSLIEGHRYIIDMESSHFSAYVKLLDSQGAIMAFDDEACMERPARMVFTAPRTGTYRLVATSVSPFATGVYTLTVCED